MGYFIPARYGLGVWPDRKIVGAPSPPSASLGNSGRHSGQETIIRCFPKVLGSWFEIWKNGDRGSTQNFAADVVSVVAWPGEPFFEKMFNF